MRTAILALVVSVMFVGQAFGQQLVSYKVQSKQTFTPAQGFVMTDVLTQGSAVILRTLPPSAESVILHINAGSGVSVQIHQTSGIPLPSEPIEVLSSNFVWISGYIPEAAPLIPVFYGGKDFGIIAFLIACCLSIGWRWWWCRQIRQSLPVSGSARC